MTWEEAIDTITGLKEEIAMLRGHLKEAESERDRMAALCDALEKLLVGFCCYCINHEVSSHDEPCSPCLSSGDWKDWQFDEARFIANNKPNDGTEVGE